MWCGVRRNRDVVFTDVYYVSSHTRTDDMFPPKNPEPTIRQPFIQKHFLKISYKYEFLVLNLSVLVFYMKDCPDDGLNIFARNISNYT
jgi:hypothetical protein